MLWLLASLALAEPAETQDDAPEKEVKVVETTVRIVVVTSVKATEPEKED